MDTLLAAVVGVVVGFAAVFLRLPAPILAAFGVLLLGFAYLQQARVRQVGVLIFAAGATAAVVLGLVLIGGALDHAVRASPETLPAFLAAIAASVGGLVLVLNRR